MAARKRHRQLRRPWRQGRLSQPVRPSPRDVSSSLPIVKLGAVGFRSSGRSDFDGFDPVTFLHADTLDSSRNRMAAGRIWVDVGGQRRRGAARSALASRFEQPQLSWPTTSSTGRQRHAADARRAGPASVHHRPYRSTSHHRRAEHERENVPGERRIYGGATDQDRNRKHNSLTPSGGPDAVRSRRRRRPARHVQSLQGRDVASRIGAGECRSGFRRHRRIWGRHRAADLLRSVWLLSPEVSLEIRRLSRKARADSKLRSAIAEAASQARLPATDSGCTTRSSIPSTPSRLFRAPRTGRQQAVGRVSEAECEWSLSGALRTSANYAYLDASQPDERRERRKSKRSRRPKHSGSVSGRRRLRAGLLTACVDRLHRCALRTRTSTPSLRARDARAYWLAGARVAYRLRKAVELFARTANAFDAHYQDALGYRTEGRSVYAGIRLAGG